MVLEPSGCFLPLAADRESAAAAWLTSPRQTRAWGFRCTPSGRNYRRGRFGSMFTPRSRACIYKNASGQGKWPNRDPIGEQGGLNLYGYVYNNPVSYVDPFGLDLFVVTESGLIQHQYLFGDNGDGTFWYTDFGPEGGGLNRIYGPGQVGFGPDMHPNEVDDPNKSIVIIPCDQKTTKKIRGMAQQRANQPPPNYCFLGYNCYSHVNALLSAQRRLNPLPPISNVNVNSWQIVAVPRGVRIF